MSRLIRENVMLNIKKIVLASVVVASPLVLLAAPVSIDIKDASGKTFNCVSKGMRVDATGKTVITVESLDCVKENNQELDSDKDGYSDIVEKREGSDPNDPNDTPDDFDKDFDPDSTDPDDDNDGYTDIEEEKAGTNPKDPNSKPKPPTTTPISLKREADIVDKFNNYYVPYADKVALKPQVLKNGKKVYIVNPGFAATSVPSCVNGKNPQDNCVPTGWAMGVKQNEIYALRQMTKSGYTTASMQIETNQKSGGLARDADYIYHISDKPGDMIGTPFEGKCEMLTKNSRGALYFTVPGTKPYINWGFYCEIPANTAFYINIELQSRSYELCNKSESFCTGYIYDNGLADPEKLLDKGEVYDKFGKYLY